MKPSTRQLAFTICFTLIGLHDGDAATVFNGGAFYSAAQWSNGLPSAGNDGNVANDGTFAGNVNFNAATPGSVTVNHTAGTLTGDSFNIRNNAAGGATYQWNQNGGNISASFFVANNRISYNFISGNIAAIASPQSGARLQVVNSGSFHQTGGTVTGLGYDFTSTTSTTHHLTGGTGVDIGAAWSAPGAWVFQVANLNTVLLGGSYNATFRDFTLPEFKIGSTGVLDFQNDWTGTLTNNAFTDDTGWESVLTQTGVKVDGTQITGANFDNFFTITNGGTTVAAIPEPSVALLGVLGALGMLRRRR